MSNYDMLPGFDQEPENRKQVPVNCLGLTFGNDEARRAHFTEELRKKLQNQDSVVRVPRSTLQPLAPTNNFELKIIPPGTEDFFITC